MPSLQILPETSAIPPLLSLPEVLPGRNRVASATVLGKVVYTFIYTVITYSAMV